MRVRKLKVISKDGILKDAEVEAYILEPEDRVSVKEQGVTKEEFFSVLDKASQPIRKQG